YTTDYSTAINIMKNIKKQLPILLALISAALFGSATPASKILLDSFSPIQLAGLLYLGAAIGVIPLLVKDKDIKLPTQLSTKNRWYLLGAIVFGGIIAPVFLLLGLRFASAASVSLWLNLELVATAILGYCFFQDNLGLIGWIGVGGCILAAVLLSVGEGVAGIEAGLLVTIACIAWGLDNHFTALIDGISPTQSTFYKGTVAGSLNLLLGILIEPSTTSPGNIFIALGIGILAYGISIVLYITSAQSLGATRSQMLFSSAPFFGILFSALILREEIILLQMIALLLKIFSLFALFQDQHSHKHRHLEIAHQHQHNHSDGHHSHDHTEFSTSLVHSHWHDHQRILHTHFHIPDIHHRHQHHSFSDQESDRDISSTQVSQKDKDH
ncbi:MAG: DMT family transporter, partial [Cyanobacteria bacterium P01_F01_bin.143]